MPARLADNSPLRRVLMQSIMWLILAATVGLAALVDAHQSRRSVAALGEPTRIENLTLRLPAGWKSGDPQSLERDAAVELRDPADDEAPRVIDVQLAPISFFEAFGMQRRRPEAATPIPFGDVKAPLSVYRDLEQDADTGASYFVLRTEVARPLGDGRTLTLRLSHVGLPGGPSGQREQAQDIELIKKIAATLTIDPK